MLKLVFAEAGPAPTLELGPFHEVRIDGEMLRTERGGAAIAQHRSHEWLAKGTAYFRLDCEGPVRLYLEDEQGKRSADYGPFFHFSCADGIAYGDGAIYANIDLETRRWYCHMDSRYWRELVVRSASAPAA